MAAIIMVGERGFK